MRLLSAGKARWAFVMAFWALAAGREAAAATGSVTLTNRTPASAAATLSGENPGALGGIGPESALDRADLGAAIRGIYERFAEVTKASGDEIEFAISDVTTYRPGELDEVLWLGLFTLPGGPTIETVPHGTRGRLPSQSVASYRSEWREADSTEGHAQEFLAEVSMLRTSEVLDRLAAWEPARYAGVAALSSLAVTVRFQGGSRSYRALVLWKPLGPEALLFTLVDWVVPGVVVAFNESRPVVGVEGLGEGGGGPEGFNSRDQSVQMRDCFPLFRSLNLPKQVLSGGQGHGSIFKKHRSRLEVYVTCNASTECNSQCSSHITRLECVDDGDLVNPLYKHIMFLAEMSDSITGIGPGVQSQCGRAVGCAVKSCLFGVCGANLEFSLSGQGAGLTLAVIGGNHLQDLSVHSGASCAGAVERPGPVNPCTESASSVVVLPVDGGRVTFELPADGIPLRRLEDGDVMHHGQRIRYLMPEWALVSYSAGGEPGSARAVTLGTSGDAFSETQIEELSRTLALGVGTRAGASSGTGTALLVAMPTHEANSRRIPMPDFQVAETRVPAGSGQGKVLVRADFADDFHLQALDFLYDSLGGVSHALALHIEKALSLRPLSDEEHRVVVFALLSVGDSLEPEIVLSSLPSCCCQTDPEGPPCV